MKVEPSYADVRRILSCPHRWAAWRQSGVRHPGGTLNESTWRRECGKCGLSLYIRTGTVIHPPDSTPCQWCGWPSGLPLRSYRWPGGMEWPSGLGDCIHRGSNLDATIEHDATGCEVRVVCQVCDTPASWQLTPGRQRRQ